MSDLRGPLERESETFDLAPGALERTLDRQRRRQRRHRTEAVLVAAVVAGLGIWAVMSLGGLRHRPSIPARPSSQLEGTWQTGRLTERDVVDAFVTAGGTTEEGHSFFAQLGGGARRFAVITLRFENGSFVQFESGDGDAPITGYQATYHVSDAGILIIASPSCTGTYSFHAESGALRLQVIDQCARHDGPYSTTLFASFPFTERI
jgi:hypothetical protein